MECCSAVIHDDIVVAAYPRSIIYQSLLDINAGLFVYIHTTIKYTSRCIRKLEFS